MKDVRFDITFIRNKAELALIERGMPKKDAILFVDTMIASDMNGVSTHGIRMLPAYLQKIDRNEFSFDRPSVIKQLPSFTIVDAKNTIGAVSANFAADIAIEQAKINGIHTVFCRNANTFGAGFYYTEKIADSGMIGFVCSNSPAAMPAYNGLEALLGTNPLAFAVPTRSGDSISVDMATSVVAKSKFGTAKAEGLKLEPGWAIDKNGNPTLDPDEGIQGLVLPMAGFKGYAIALIIDILSGFLSGAAYLNDVGKFYSQDGRCMNVGHMITAFNPELVFDGDYWAEIEKYILKLRTSKSVKDHKIVVPGDRKRSNKTESLKHGIALTDDVVEKLEKIFKTELLLCSEE